MIPQCRGVPGGATHSRSVPGNWLPAVPLVPSLWDAGSCLQTSNCSAEGTATAAVAAIFGIIRTRISSVNRIEVTRSYFVSGAQIQASTPGFLTHLSGLLPVSAPNSYCELSTLKARLGSRSLLSGRSLSSIIWLKRQPDVPLIPALGRLRQEDYF